MVQALALIYYWYLVVRVDAVKLQAKCSMRVVNVKSELGNGRCCEMSCCIIMCRSMRWIEFWLETELMFGKIKWLFVYFNQCGFSLLVSESCRICEEGKINMLTQGFGDAGLRTKGQSGHRFKVRGKI